MSKTALACLLAGTLLGSGWAAQSAGPPGSAATGRPATSIKKVPSSTKPARREGPGITESARKIYELQWGVNRMSAQLAESGQLVRFSYQVTDAAKAAILNDKASSPYLLDEKAHAVLQVPTMEKVGPLRQSNSPENGKSYWMVFSNKGYIVKPGHQVSIVVGHFRVDKLIVE
jgi:hypothetical protein